MKYYWTDLDFYMIDETKPKPAFSQILAVVSKRRGGWNVSHWADASRRNSTWTEYPGSMGESEVKACVETMMRLMQ